MLSLLQYTLAPKAYKVQGQILIFLSGSKYRKADKTNNNERSGPNNTSSQ